ncbi:NAD dependent epimerase/dehydratase family protein [Enterococcus faecalis 13-SD-W-01]|nr:NAD dependent epimerase/dehydratase family protein [Enterococcus faecalis 13-SD-W-01]
MKKYILVTGGTGFLGMQLIYGLLQEGYPVKTTVRSLKSSQRVIETLKKNGAKNIENLVFAEADLTKDDHWEELMADCEYVFSMASPVFFGEPENEDELIRPAKEGIIRILKAASHSNIRRVVMTSNFGAIGFSNKNHQKITTEADWTDENEAGLSIYEKSKLLAEKAAWAFVKQEKPSFEFATVNPVAIYGPSLDEHFSGSFSLLTGLFDGTFKRIPPLPLNVIDVRDVVSLHIRSMFVPEAAGERFIASADGQISLVEIAELIQKKRPEIAGKLSLKQLPNWAVTIGALFNQRAKEGKLLMEINRDISNEKAKQLLGWKPTKTNEEAVLAGIDSMIKYNGKEWFTK